MSILFLCENKPAILNAYTSEQIGEHLVLNSEELKQAGGSNARIVFSTWGMPALSKDEIRRYLPKAEAVFYAAGTVQGFAAPFLDCGVRIFSAWAANAIPVAEFASSQILLANKGYFQLHRRYSESHAVALEYAKKFPGNYGTKVGLLGAGMIGRHVIKLLSPCELDILVFDPFLPDEKAQELNVRKASLSEIFSVCQTISNHLANNAQTKGILDYALFSLMKSTATFINTGRGAQIVAEDLIRALREQPDRTALLDVTDPTEPLPSNSEFWKIPGAVITPHRAGSICDEVFRMGKFMFDDFARLQAGEQPLHEVTREMLATMA